MQALLENDGSLLYWLSLLNFFRLLLCDISDGLLRLLNVVGLAQISNDTLSRVDMDSCFLSDAISAFQVLLELIWRNSRKCIFDLDVFSNGLIYSLNGILDVEKISDDYV